MKKWKRVAALIAAVAMVFTMTGCKSTSNSSKDGQGQTDGEKVAVAEGSNKPITLEWWYRGNGVQKDTELVEDKLNEMLKNYSGMENVTVHLNCYTGAEYKNAIVLAQSADKQMDILNTVSLDMAEEVEKGSFLPLNDYLNEMTDLKSLLPEWLWDLGSVDGNTYIVPNYQRASNNAYFITPKQYMDSYGDIDAMRSAFQNPDRTVEEIGAVLEDYGLKVQAGEGKTKYMPALATMYYGLYGFTDFFDSVYGDFIRFNGTDEVVNKFMTEDIQKAYEVSANWYKEGLIHPDILTINPTDLQGANMLNDVSMIFTINNQAGDEARVSEIYSDMYGFDVYAIPINTQYYITNTWGAGGNGVTESCKNPDKAMRFIELMNTEEGKDLYNLMVYGIEGTHYTKDSATRITTLEYTGTQGGVDTSYSAMKWIIGNTFNAYLNQGCLDDDNAIALGINESTGNVKSDLIGYSPKTDNISIQLEQSSAVSAEYSKPLYNGVLGGDWKSYYDEYVNKLETAGLNEILTDLQKQVDEFTGK